MWRSVLCKCAGFLPSFLPSFLASFLPSFLPSFLHFFLLSFLRSFVRSFLPSSFLFLCLLAFLPAGLLSFLPSSLPSFLPPSLYAFLPYSLREYLFLIPIIFVILIVYFHDPDISSLMPVRLGSNTAQLGPRLDPFGNNFGPTCTPGRLNVGTWPIQRKLQNICSYSNLPRFLGFDGSSSKQCSPSWVCVGPNLVRRCSHTGLRQQLGSS